MTTETPVGPGDHGNAFAAISAQYARRDEAMTSLYSFSRPEVLWNAQAVDRATRDLLDLAGLTAYSELRVLEVGCGSGGNLLRFLQWGFQPHHLVGNELLPDRVAAARRVLPASVNVYEMDARSLQLGGFDIVLQSTVLSSILQIDTRREVAHAMWRHVAPGGVLLSYDFTYDNPKNRDVKKVTVKDLRQLFPEGMMRTRRVTLAPPLARRTANSPILHGLLESVPMMRTHRVATIRRDDR